MRRRWSIRRPRAAALVASLVTLACASGQQGGGPRASDPATLVPRLFDPTDVYRGMGLLAVRDPLAFVASVRFLDAPGADSTLAIVGISMPNNTLSFRRAGDLFEARYRVDVAFRDSSRIVLQFSSDQTVRVASFRETQRSDESVVFQRFAALPPGRLTASVAVRDLYGAAFNRAERVVQVPHLGAQPGLSDLVPVYRATPRPAIDSTPALIVNPRGMVPYGTDTLVLYVESYGLDGRAGVVARAVVRDGGEELWRDSVEVERVNGVGGAVFKAAPDRLPVGVISFEALHQGGGDTVRTPGLVSFSDAWAVQNFEQTLSLLRYFGHDTLRRALAEAPRDQRAERWRELWTASDPNPVTPENEALEDYFERLDEANELYKEGVRAGWLTDRGEVYITLGPPDQTFDSGTDIRGRRERVIRWDYFQHRLSLDFVDETGSGYFRLTPASRVAFLTVLNRVRRNA